MAKEITFNFWKENKKANHFTLTDSELEQRFTEWLGKQDNDWLTHYMSDVIINCFISREDGLNSVNEPDEYAMITIVLIPLYLKHIETPITK